MKIAEKLATSSMFYTNIATCAYAILKSSETAASHACYYILKYQTYVFDAKYAHTYVYLLVIVSYLLSLPTHMEKTSTLSQAYSTC